MKKKHILYIEDNKFQAKLFEGLFKKLSEELNCEFINSASGKEGLELIRNNKAISGLKRNNIDVIILDLSLPDISGMDLLREMGKLPEEDKIPVIVMSAHEETDLITQSMKLGAIDYFIKGRGSDEMDRFVKILGKSLGFEIKLS